MFWKEGEFDKMTVKFIWKKKQMNKVRNPSKIKKIN